MRSTSSSAPFLLTADLRDDQAKELILIDGSDITIFNSHGEILDSLTIEDAVFHAGITADIDGDGKSELILGTAGDKNSRLVCINGFLHTLFDEPIIEMVKGNTTPVSFKDNKIYFFAVSEYHISPKLVAAFDVKKMDPAWIYRFGQVPIGLSFSKDLEMKDTSTSDADGVNDPVLAVSHRAVSSDWREVDETFPIPKNQQGLYLLKDRGEGEFFSPIGPNCKTGYSIEEGISGIKQSFFDLDGDGVEEVLLVLERFSDLYSGSTELQVRAKEGELLASYQGPEKTEASFAVTEGSKDWKVCLAWKQHGKVVLLNQELQVVKSLELPGKVHHTEIHKISDVTGDDKLNILITDEKHLYLTDDQLNLLWQHEFDNIITSLASMNGPNTIMRIGVVARDLYLLDPWSEVETGKEEKSPVQGSSGGFADLPPLPEAGTVSSGESYTIDPRATLSPPPKNPVASYSSFQRSAEAEAPPGFCYASSDFIGGPEKELVFYDRKSNTITLMDINAVVLHSFTFHPEEQGRHISFIDVDSNGKTDIITYQNTPSTIVVRNGLGELIFKKSFFYGYDSHVHLLYISDTLWLFGAETGYMLSPRGYYGYDPQKEKINFFYPTGAAVLTLGVLHHGDTFFGSGRTVNNGAVVDLPGGRRDSDNSLFFHVFNETGSILSDACQLTHKDNTGNIKAFSCDLDGDGKTEVYIQEGKYEGYYEGTSRIYRYTEEEGTLSVVHEGPKDGNGLPYYPLLFLQDGNLMLALRYAKPGFVEFLDNEFRLIKRFKPEIPDTPGEYFHPGFITLHDLDGDNTWEMFARGPKALYVMDLGGEILRKLEVAPEKDGALMRYEVEDIDLDGKPEIVLSAEKRVRVYSY